MPWRSARPFAAGITGPVARRDGGARAARQRPDARAAPIVRNMVGEFARRDNCGCLKHPFPRRKAAKRPPGGRRMRARPAGEHRGRENHEALKPNGCGEPSRRAAPLHIRARLNAPARRAAPRAFVSASAHQRISASAHQRISASAHQRNDWRAPSGFTAMRTDRRVRPPPLHPPVRAAPYPTRRPAGLPPCPARCRAARPPARAAPTCGRRRR